jgi:hypothetical protein
MEYIKTFVKNNLCEIKGVEIPIRLPDQPPRSEMLNFDLPKSQQIFRRIDVPHDLAKWESAKEAEFVEREWHRRWNGVWILIGGEPVYLTGTAYLFFNYWRAESGDFPDFRMEAVEFFQILDHIENDPNYYGIFDVKSRRMGDTEKTLCYGWDLTTRYRSSWFGMMNKNDDDAQENFDRVVMSNRDMVYFFRPKSMGNDMPKEELIFRYKSTTSETTHLENIQELRSRVDFRSTVFGAYDGKRLRFFHGDEPSKIRVSKMQWTEQWPVVKLCLSLENGRKIIGKAALTTTIEDMDEGESIEEMRKLWDASNPLGLNKNNQTITGLLRIFRGYWLTAPVDQFGRHKVEEETRRRDDTIDQMRKAGLASEIIAYKRKFPATVEDALAVPDRDCILLPGLLDEQINKIQSNNMLGISYINKPVRGNLAWTSGFGSDVQWLPNDQGRWWISGHPEIPNNRDWQGGYCAPGNKGKFAMGVDPVDDYKPDGGGSYGAFAIHKMFDPASEDPAADAWGLNPVRSKMKTDRCCCTYRFRPDNPYDFYDDCLMTAIYFGVDMLIEKAKPGLITYCEAKSYFKYLAFNPNMKVSVYKQPRAVDYGAPASSDLITAYIRELKTTVAVKVQSQTHLDLLEDHKQFTGTPQNRGKRDLTVAYGWALLYAQSMYIKLEKQSRKNKRKFMSPFRMQQYGGRIQ